MKRKMERMARMIGLSFIICHLSFSLCACSEDTAESNEYENWQQRNEQYFATLEDSLQSNPTAWLKLKSYSLSDDVEGQLTDYVYAHVIRSGSGTDSPMLTDSVRVSYRGHLMPSASYPEGYVFDPGTAYGNYDDDTNSTTKFVMVSSGSEALVSGWITTLLHMHRGDYWRIYIPYTLGYDDSDQKSGSTVIVPAYSTLIFDLTLVDFSSVGEQMQPYSARLR